MVVSVYSSLPSIDNVAQLRVNVTDGPDSQQLLYPDKPLAAPALLRLVDPNTPAATPVTFSVSFRPTFKADVTVDGGGSRRHRRRLLGRGTSAPQPLNLGRVTYARRVSSPPTCDPMAPASTCGDGYTCALVCDQNSQPNQLCFSAGKANPGDSCADTTDCVPGSGCFEFTDLLHRRTADQDLPKVLHQRCGLWRWLFLHCRRFLRQHQHVAPHLLASLRPHRRRNRGLRRRPALLHLYWRDHRLRLSAMNSSSCRGTQPCHAPDQHSFYLPSAAR